MHATSKANVQAMVEERAPKAVRSEGTAMLDGKDLAAQMLASHGYAQLYKTDVIDVL